MKTAVELSPLVAQWMVQALARLLATFGILQGIAICAGGAVRWSEAPSLKIAMLVPGAPASWGIAIGVLGAVALTGTFLSRLRLTALALLGIGAWCFFFALGMFISVLHSPSAPSTGVFTYIFLAVMACTLATAYRQSRSYQRRLRAL